MGMQKKQHQNQDSADRFTGKAKSHAKAAKYGQGLQSQGETSTSRPKGQS